VRIIVIGRASTVRTLRMHCMLHGENGIGEINQTEKFSLANVITHIYMYFFTIFTKLFTIFLIYINNNDKNNIYNHKIFF